VKGSVSFSRKSAFIEILEKPSPGEQYPRLHLTYFFKMVPFYAFGFLFRAMGLL
jgi:hypothetical protein